MPRLATTPAQMPPAPALVAGPRGAVWWRPSGAVEHLTVGQASARALKGPPPLVCHLPATARRLGLAPFPAFDILELFAFVRPAHFCLPTPSGLAAALGLARPRGLEAEAALIAEAARRLLAELGEPDLAEEDDLGALAALMAGAGWTWGEPVMTALGATEARPGGLDVWNRVPAWREFAPPPPAGQVPVEPAEARARLAALLGPEAEARPEQADYASAASAAFEPPQAPVEPRFVLAEAGTGVGKTLGYIAPASLWAQKNEGAVWISTYTKNLQRQVDQELDRLYPNPAVKARRVVVRKGRENYLCLLNYEEAAREPASRHAQGVALGIVARWARHTRDGDLLGGDLPAWLLDLLGGRRLLRLTDHRGECIYAACPHYRRCFIERGVRRARRAEVVVANHALVMVHAAMGARLGGEERELPTRYVFDEGHHLFEAADGAFSAHLSARETAELRRWVLGKSRRRGRARGLKHRIADLVADGEAEEALEAALRAARALPGDGWDRRLQGGAPRGPAERFFAAVRTHVLARAARVEGPYSLEAETTAPEPGLMDAAQALDRALAGLGGPLVTLSARLAARLDAEAADLDSQARYRIEAMCRGLRRRGEIEIEAWRAMIGDLKASPHAELFDWFSIKRREGREIDVGMHRHWVDPTRPFAGHVARRAHGLLVTSATLRDGTGDVDADWAAAEARTGAVHLSAPAVRAAVLSPFDYAASTRVMVVRDVDRNDPDRVAAAYRELFLATGGGALGLFTAIARLKSVYERIAGALDDAGLSLLAQHVDAVDTGTLVDIFRADRDACLLGTDAVRDGIDVPGPALRLIVFDRVPWPRPDLLHRVRRQAFGRTAYDDMLARFRLKQAYGRLVRRADDRGVFVLLDPMMPARLAGAFPEGVVVRRVGLAEAVRETRSFLGK
ncbi:MAG: ATP-dependent DNA helicase [Alphaproteobacteria bacterium]